MLKIKRSERFKKNLIKLLKKRALDIGQVEKFLRLLLENPGHPSLRVKKIQGTEDVFEASFNLYIRITFNYVKPDTIYLRNVGEHDITLKKH